MDCRRSFYASTARYPARHRKDGRMPAIKASRQAYLRGARTRLKRMTCGSMMALVPSVGHVELVRAEARRGQPQAAAAEATCQGAATDMW